MKRDPQQETMLLSIIEHGAYTRLMDYYFKTNLLEDFISLYRICRAITQAEQNAVRVVADRFFPVSEEDGFRHNLWADLEIARARPRIEASWNNGKKGGRPKTAIQKAGKAEL